MTIEEAMEKCKMLEKLNLSIWNASSSVEESELRKNFKSIVNELTLAGMKIRKWKSFDETRGYRIPRFSIIKPNYENNISIVDNRETGGNHNGDCTTRCISFCTGVNYLTIQKEQFANAVKMSTDWRKFTWRNSKVWSQSLLSRGFCEIILPRHVSRKVFLRMFKDSEINDGIIATKSANHVAAIDMKTKKILDTWDSSGGRIISIFVPISQKMCWFTNIRNAFGRSPIM